MTVCRACGLRHDPLLRCERAKAMLGTPANMVSGAVREVKKPKAKKKKR